MAKRRADRSRLRIIGGQWRSRCVSFESIAEVRPTPDRVRETLFNWLQSVIPGAHCLDLFAGSGALGFEAASRGAANVCLVDSNPNVRAALGKACEQLHADNIRIFHSEALAWLQSCQQRFDIVFLDPPFARPQLIQESLHVLAEKGLLNPQGRVYVEVSSRINIDDLVDIGWNRLKGGRAGEVGFYLLCRRDMTVE